MAADDAIHLPLHINGLLAKNLPHVVEKIFLDFLEFPDFERSLNVCRTWRTALSKHVILHVRNRARLESDRIAHLWHKGRPEQRELQLPTTRKQGASENVVGLCLDRCAPLASCFSSADRVVIWAKCVPAATLVVVFDLQGNVIDNIDWDWEDNVSVMTNDSLILVTFPVGFDRGYDRAKCFDLKTQEPKEVDLGALHSAIKQKDFTNGLGKLKAVNSDFFALVKVDDEADPDRNSFCLWRLQYDSPDLEMKKYREFRTQDHRCGRSEHAHALDERWVFVGCNHGHILLYDHLAGAVLWQKDNTSRTKEIKLVVNSGFAVTHEVYESVVTDPITVQKISVYDIFSGDLLKQLDVGSFHHFAPCEASDKYVAVLWKKTNDPFRADQVIRPELKFMPSITVTSLKTFKSFDLAFSMGEEVMMFKVFHQRLLFVQVHEQQTRQNKVLIYDLERSSSPPNIILSTKCSRPFTVAMGWEAASGLALLSRRQDVLTLMSFRKGTDLKMYLEEEASEETKGRPVKKLKNK